uniref:Uncharacterized protein n=1 Tax=Aegilops tauschii subsp. strangulata TaxID=200361 RepID=A0A453APE4_AEGTS
MDSSSGEKGLHRCKRGAGKQRPPGAGLQPGTARGRVPQEGPGHGRHGGPLRRAHHRPGAVQLLPLSDLRRRHQHQRRLRRVAPGQLPPVRRQRQPGAAGHDDAQRVRQRILHGPPVPEGAHALGPGAVQRRHHRQHGPELRVQPGGVQQRLHDGHDQDGQHRAAHRGAGPDQAQLLQG